MPGTFTVLKGIFSAYTAKIIVATDRQALECRHSSPTSSVNCRFNACMKMGLLSSSSMPGCCLNRLGFTLQKLQSECSGKAPLNIPLEEVSTSKF